LQLAELADNEKVRKQLQVWREHLIDVSRGNPLLGINRSRTSKLHATFPDAAALFGALVLDGRAVRMPLITRAPTPGTNALGDALEPSEASGVLEWQVHAGDVEFEDGPAQVSRRLRRARENARATEEERGVTTLHATFGSVRWTDPQLGDSEAPVLLVPARFTKAGPRPSEPEGRLLLGASDEEPVVNPALMLYLRERYGITVPSIPDEFVHSTLPDLLEELRRRIPSGWSVSDDVWLSTFSFETLSIYQDLSRLEQAALRSPIVRAFSGVRVALDGGASEALGDDLDAYPVPEIVPNPADKADSSQLEALVYSRRGQHVVVHGPPGTGKSQTITNLIADALGQGKTVLFVSAKAAALEVVHRRLAALGLERFCLEAHSIKAGKARIADELKRALAEPAAAARGSDDASLARYLSLRAMLDYTVSELHRPRGPMGATVYQAIGRLSRLVSMPSVECALPWPDPKEASREQLQAALDALGELRANSQVFGARDSHPWRGCGSVDASYAAREQLLSALALIRERLEATLVDLRELAAILGPSESLCLDGLEAARNALLLLRSVAWLPEGWRRDPASELQATAKALQGGAAVGEDVRGAQAAFAEATENVDPEGVSELLISGVERYAPWYRRISPGYLAWKRRIASEVRPKGPGKTAVSVLAEYCWRIRAGSRWLTAHGDLSRRMQPPGSMSPESLTEAAAAYSAAAALASVRGRLGLRPAEAGAISVGEAARGAAEAVATRLASQQQDLAQALALLDRLWPGGFSGGKAVGQTSVAALVARCDDMLKASSLLGEWVFLCMAVASCEKQGLGAFLDAVGQLGCDDAPDVFRRLFWLRWADAQIANTPALSAFRGATQADIVAEFSRLDQSVRSASLSAAVERARLRADQARATTEVSRESELGILRRDVERKRPRPLRKLFADVPQVLQALKPCMLMSPVSVSTYLDPDRIHFDLVVFDEASQIRPEEAVPSLLRANQAIVAGDENQLPPTSFFSSSLFASDEEDDDESDDREPLESLLHECKALVPLFQQAHLRWHYRSRDERLIAFSNDAFYGGSLITFPSPGSPDDRGVKLEYVPDGRWDRGKSKTNRAEARRVVDLVVQLLRDHPYWSIGVVAMNVSQKEAVEDALDEALSNRPDLRAALEAKTNEPDEPFFVKPLENVQGDERGAIIITVGYGPDLRGEVHLNFGPLNQEGGWRRLNVLVTRAKYLTVLVTSLRSDQLRDVSPSNRGATALREFIAYAERGGRLAPGAARLTNQEPNDFEDSIAAALVSRGLEVDQQIGASSYRIDLAVRDPRDPSWYVIGIECDGATYHSSRTARDRDLLRAEILRGMGWRLHRIRSLDWFRDPEGETARAVRAVELAMAAGRPESGVEAPASYPSSGAAREDAPPKVTAAEGNETRGPSGVPWRSSGAPYVAVRRRRPNRELLLDSGWGDALSDEIIQVVSAEQPIHPELLLERLKELHDVGRAGRNVQDNFRVALRHAVATETVEIDTAGFASRPGIRVDRFRFPPPGGEVRPIRHTHPEEIALAAISVVESQFGLPEEPLVREVAVALGYARTSADIADRIRAVVESLVDDGRLRRAGLQIQLP